MGMATGSKGGAMADINVTPLVDIVLVLLIIFMVVTPMLQRGKDVKLPVASKQKGKETKDADPLVLSITPDKEVFVEQDAFDDANLGPKLRREIELAPGRKLLVKGDLSLTYGDVRKVMKIAQEAGAKGIALGVEEAAQ